MTFTLDRAWNPLRCRVAIFLASAAPNTSFATADVASRIGKTLTFAPRLAQEAGMTGR
ncbi:MAG: hypothetical protein JO284_14495 [Planctomycetaceae bacterium]|nr:hypothetical protein [Planctomycetaceae bacterium]MBV8609321.1 hypothetical protein [Singulisphaera sp.]MBV8233144.1 hypothetical protein [Planctomycetaceae bacterium]MBV8266491.1 hypothetical protein [Planctomycetaceae bacterium]MBV8314038.1 hypothetical protein [Planctomycetaceae bacterium]